ncbi:MAG: glycosyltransferase family 9 protein [Bryobacteraceae bacterium]
MRILLVRLGAMGDIIHALPAAATIRTALGHCSLTWMVEPRWAPLLAGNPYVDELLPFDRRSAAGIRDAIVSLRRGSFSLALDLQGLIKSALAAVIARPDRVFGLHRSLVREKPAALFYSSAVESSAAHVVDRYIDVALAAGGGRPARLFPIPAGEAEGELPAGRFILACPLAGWTSKQWPLEHWEALGRRLGEAGVPLVLNGPPAAAATLAKVGSAHVHLSGLPGLIDASRRALAVVGVDSGPLHLAAALDKPGVAIFGPTDPARNGPYGESIRVVRARDAETTYRRGTEIAPSMRAISPESVFETLTAALTGTRGS